VFRENERQCWCWQLRFVNVQLCVYVFYFFVYPLQLYIVCAFVFTPSHCPFLSRRTSARIVYFCADQNFWRFLQKGEKRKRKTSPISFFPNTTFTAHISPILLHLATALVVNVCIHNDVCKRTLSTLEQHPAQPRTGERFTREIRTRCRYV